MKTMNGLSYHKIHADCLLPSGTGRTNSARKLRDVTQILDRALYASYTIASFAISCLGRRADVSM